MGVMKRLNLQRILGAPREEFGPWARGRRFVHYPPMKRQCARVVQHEGRFRVKVETARGHVDWPVLHPDGLITYEDPSRVPKYVMAQVRALFRNRDLGQQLLFEI
jgi:hypothetical protein